MCAQSNKTVRQKQFISYGPLKSEVWSLGRDCVHEGRHRRVHIACSEKVVVKSPDASQASTASTSGLLCVYFGPILVVFRNLYCCQSSLSTTFSPRSLHSLGSSPPRALVTAWAWARCPLLLGCGVLLPPSPTVYLPLPSLTNSFPNFPWKGPMHLGILWYYRLIYKIQRNLIIEKTSVLPSELVNTPSQTWSDYRSSTCNWLRMKVSIDLLNDWGPRQSDLPRDSKASSG